MICYHLHQRFRKQWKNYSFKVNFRNHILKVNIAQEETNFEMLKWGRILKFLVNDKPVVVKKQSTACGKLKKAMEIN